MKQQSSLSGKSKKHVINLLAAEFAQRMVKLKYVSPKCVILFTILGHVS